MTRSVAAIVLAAGRASRFGADPEDSKVLATLDGTPLVRLVAETALSSRATMTVVVTGQAAAGVATALVGLPLRLVHNPRFAHGMASSLQTGLAALPADVEGSLVLLADMPRVAVATLDALIAAFGSGSSPEAVAPTYRGRHGNPVLLGRTLFAEVAELDGDQGARRLLAQAGRHVVACPVDDEGIVIDVDTRTALSALGGSAATS